MKQFLRVSIAGLVLALTANCVGADPPPPPDDDPDPAEPTAQLTPQESRGISAAGGRVSNGGIVFDVELGYGVSKQPSSSESTGWRGDSPHNH